MVKVKILNEKGHTDLDLGPREAAELVAQETASGKWAFVDGVFMEAVSLSVLRAASEVVVTNKLMGG